MVMMGCSMNMLQWESLSEKSCYMHATLRDMGLMIAEENKEPAHRQRVLFPALQNLQRKSIMERELSIGGESKDP